jgi:UDP-glucoronosyl and UDP-glucosyl transferase
VKTLGLEPMSTLWAPGQTHRLKVPYTYLWSPGLVPKPADWGPQIDIAGFVFLDLASTFKPPTSLVKFLESGNPPIYIGFGSIVPDDPEHFTQIIFEAIKKTGVRALVSKGWGGLGSDDVPDNIYMLENTPHDWIFPRVSAVIHHGGAGTTAICLKYGKPTMTVPFFGDQPFWGAMTAKAGAGYHKAVSYKHLTPDILAEGIKECLSPAAGKNAENLARRIAEEGDGAENAVKSFHRNLCLRGENSMRCSILEDRVCTWRLKNTKLRLSTVAAEFLVRKGKIDWGDLRLIRHNEWNDFDGPGEPATGAGAAIVWSIGNMTRGIIDVPINWTKRIRSYEKHKKSRRWGGSLSNRGAKRGSFRTVEEDKTMKPVNELSAEIAKAQKWGKEGSIPESESEFSDISDDGLAVDMAGDAIKGLRKSGKAFLKGETLGYTDIPIHSTSFTNSTKTSANGYFSCSSTRFSQCPSPLRRYYRPPPNQNYRYAFWPTCGPERVRFRCL